MGKKLSREDKQFLLKLGIDNRNHMVSLANITLALMISSISMMFSSISIVISVLEISKISLLLIFIIIITIVVYTFKAYETFKKNIEGAKAFNEQYQNFLKELYPDLDFKKYYH